MHSKRLHSTLSTISYALTPVGFVVSDVNLSSSSLNMMPRTLCARTEWLVHSATRLSDLPAARGRLI